MACPLNIGDFIALGKLAWQVYKLCKDASASFNNLSSEVLSLHAVLKEVEEIMTGNELSESKFASLTTITNGCRDVLTDLQALVTKYQRLGLKTQRTWDRMRWHSEDISELRARLSSNTVMLTAFMSSTQIVVEQKLSAFLREFRDGHHEASVITTQTVETISRNDQETWRRIRKELEDIGISVMAFESNKSFILQWFRDSIEQGFFEEQALEEISNEGNQDLKSASTSRDASLPIKQREAWSVASSTELVPEDKIAILQAQKQASTFENNLRSPRQLSDLGYGSAGHYDGYEGNPPPKIFRIVGRVLGYYDRQLWIACKHQRSSYAQLKYLLENGANPNSKQKSGETCLLATIDCNKQEVAARVKLLIAHGADVKARGFLPAKHPSHWRSTCRTPLLLAAFVGSTEVVSSLLDAGANPDGGETDEFDCYRTPLAEAAASGNLEVIGILLQRGATLNQRLGSLYHGDSSLLCAVAKGHLEVTNYLIEKGADIIKPGFHTSYDQITRKTSRWYGSPLAIAYRALYGDNSKFRAFPMLQLLLNHNKKRDNIVYAGRSQKTLLEIWQDDYVMAEFLLHNGERIVRDRNDGLSPLERARSKGEADRVVLLENLKFPERVSFGFIEQIALANDQ